MPSVSFFRVHVVLMQENMPPFITEEVLAKIKSFIWAFEFLFFKPDFSITNVRALSNTAVVQQLNSS